MRLRYPLVLAITILLTWAVAHRSTEVTVLTVTPSGWQYMSAAVMPETQESFAFAIYIVAAEGQEQKILSRPEAVLEAIQSAIDTLGLAGWQGGKR